jgi:hypothetical protein
VFEQWVGRPLPKGKFFYVLRHEFASVVYDNPEFRQGSRPPAGARIGSGIR